MKWTGNTFAGVLLTALVFLSPSTKASDWNSAFEPGESFRQFSVPLSAEARKLAIDRALAGDKVLSDSELSSIDSSDILREADVAQVTIAATGHVEFYVNPEPSSLLVWATTGMGLVAAGYGYRRRHSSDRC